MTKEYKRAQAPDNILRWKMQVNAPDIILRQKMQVQNIIKKKKEIENCEVPNTQVPKLDTDEYISVKTYKGARIFLMRATLIDIVIYRFAG